MLYNSSLWDLIQIEIVFCFADNDDDNILDHYFAEKFYPDKILEVNRAEKR